MINAIEHFSEKFSNLETFIVHAGTNDIKYGKKTEEIKNSFRLLHENTQKHGQTLVISGPVPIVNCSCDHFSRLAALNEWLCMWCQENNIMYANNFETKWFDLNLLNRTGRSLNRNGRKILAKNIENVVKKISSD